MSARNSSGDTKQIALPRFYASPGKTENEIPLWVIVYASLAVVGIVAMLTFLATVI
jgi:hypothetical protein